MADENNNVELKVTGTLDPSVEAAFAKAKAEMAALSAANQSFARDLIAGNNLSATELQKWLGDSNEAKENFAAISRAVAAAKAAEAAQAASTASALEAETAARITLTKAESEQLGVRMAMARQQFGADAALGTSAFDVQRRMTAQRIKEETAAEAAITKAQADAEAARVADAAIAGKAQNAIDASTFEFQQRMTKQRAAEFAAAEAAMTEDAAIAGKAQIAIEAQKDADAATAAKAQMAMEREQLAFQMNMTAQRVKLAEEEIAANTKVGFSWDVLGRKAISGRSVMEGEALARGLLTGNMTRVASAAAVETARLNLLQYAFSGIGVSIMAAVAALVAFGVAMDQAKKAAEWAADLKKASDTLGLTTTQLQEFDHVFASIGVDVEKGRHALSGLEQSIGQVEAGGTRARQITKVFKEELKISPEDLRGWGDLGDQIPHVVDALAAMNVQERAAAEKRLKVDPETIQSMIDYKDQIKGLIEQAHQYGIIIPEDVINSSAKASNTMKQWSDITHGELRAAFIQLAPLIAGSAQLTANLAGKFADGVRGAVDIAKAIHDVFTQIGNFIQSMDKAIPLLGEIDRLLGLMPGNANSAADAVNHLKERLDASLNPLGQFVHLLQQFGAADRAADAAKIAAEPKTAPQGPRADQVLSDNTKKGPKGPDIVSEWAEQLHEKEILSKDYFKDETKDELDFWNSKLGLVKPKSKEWLEIQEKIYEASKKLAHDAYDAKIASDNEQIDAAKDNWAQEKKLLQDKVDFVSSTYGAQSKEALAAQKEMEAAEREHEKVLREMKKAADDEALKELKSNLDTARSIREADNREAESQIQYKAKYSANPLAQVQAQQQIAAMNRQTAQQNLQDMEQEHVAADKLLNDDIAAAKEGSLEWQKANDAKKLSDLEWANQHKLLLDQMMNQERADAQKIAESWHSIVDPMIKTTGDQIKGLIEGTETWGQAIRNIGEQMLSLVISAIERMVEEWIVNLLIGKTAQSQTAAAQVVSYAGIAGAAGIASMAGAPWPLDMGAPAFGNAMAAEALGFAAMASLDTGTNYVPGDMVAQIHEGERIIPKADNLTLLNALQGGGPGPRAGDFNGDFGVHLHGVGDLGSLDGRKIVKALEGAQSHFSKLLKGMHRNGKFSYAG